MDIKKSLSLVLSAFFVCGLCACSKEDLPEKDQPLGSNAIYDVLNTGEIPVGMWYTPPDGYRTDEAFRLIAECGITMVNGFGYNENTDDEVTQILDLCEKYRLKYLYSSLTLEDSIRQYRDSNDSQYIDSAMEQIEKFSSHPAYAGQLFLDEPSASYFDTLADFISAYKEKYSDKIAYVNMLPYYAVGGSGYSTYNDFVDSWIKKINPEFFSYDSYPLIDYDPSQEGYRAEMSDYYYNLDLLRAKTLEQGIPLWSFVATLGYENSAASEPSRRTPSREDLRWEVFSNLVFGSKCIQYFCYWTPGQDSFDEAIVTRGGVPTERYGYVKEVNAEFKNYGKYLLGSDAVGVMMNDYRRNGFELYSMPLTKFGPIKSVEGNRYVIGCFSDKDTGKKSVLISPTTPRDDIELTLNLYKSIKSVTAYINGEETTLAVTNGRLAVKINRGDALFIRF